MFNLLKRKPKPKKLTLHQVHELYLLLRHALPKKEEAFLINEVEYILDHAMPGTLIASLEILYKNTPKKMNGIVAAALFMRGLKENNFFSYVEFTRTLHAR